MKDHTSLFKNLKGKKLNKPDKPTKQKHKNKVLSNSISLNKK